MELCSTTSTRIHESFQRDDALAPARAPFRFFSQRKDRQEAVDRPVWMRVDVVLQSSNAVAESLVSRAQ
ncbi:MAG: hypothetical protein AAFY58_08970, partial [Planctomycetota bacterium]